MTQAQQETRLIHCYDVVSFVTEIEKAVKDGFSLDLKNVQHYPVQLGYQFITTMVKEQQEAPEEPTSNSQVAAPPDTPPAATPPARPGRPAKTK